MMFLNWMSLYNKLNSWKVDKKYESYTTEDFILDKEFAHWVLFPDAVSDFSGNRFKKHIQRR